MFVNEKLQQYLETSSSINSQPLVIGEWNMNVAENISTVGNYRHRPTATPDSSDFVYATPANFFDINDGINDGVKFYSGATDADTIIDGGLDNNDQPVAFTVPNEKERLLYSLEDCFRRFRPRSGINKLRYFEDNYTHFVNSNLTNRPRYYMASRNDSFKYWTSYRKEANVERGIANKPVGALFYIDDAVPFITYKEPIPSNKIVVKMQTGIGDVDLGPFTGGGSSFDDPFFGESNKATPNNWSIQILKDNNWIDAISFNPLSLRKDDTQVIKSDGYVEITYGLIVPEKYESKIHFAGRYPFASLLPVSPAENSAYFVQESDNELGMVYVWNGTEYESFTPSYGWRLGEESISEETHLVNNFVDPEYFIDSANGNQRYKEFEYIQGIRVVAKTMNKINSTLDLLELSPRLTANLTERTSKFSFNKSASDLGVSGMPVGQLLASNGSLDIFDYDDAFNKNNTSSILSKFTSNNLQVKLFEIIYDLSDNVVESYHIPLKTLYADGFPESSSNTRSFSVQLRDMFFYFESLNSPQLLVESASLGYAVSFLLDSIGFSNYTFKRVDEEDDPIIPYFFVKPETSVAQVLQELAVATQTAMFFDEFNNLIVMSKNYIMPSLEQRPTDIEILGSLDQAKQGVVENFSTKTKLSNIINLSSKNQEVFNDGKIIFEEKYIAKTYGSLKEASFLNQDQNWIYKPALLWEISGTPPLRSIENNQDITSSYTLAAIPLNSDLSDLKPYVQNNQVQNNIMDFGEGAYWVARYNGYLYANGEIIKYDAIEYNVSGIGNVWVSSLREYQSYFSKIKFGGKIYPTGRVRIYSEPFYEKNGDTVLIKNGNVRKDGREQFGTKIAYHSAGLPSYWSDTSASSPVRGIEMDSNYLFKSFADGKVGGIHNPSKLSLEVSIDVEEPSVMRSVVYADGKWVGVGTDGKFRTSTDAETWETVVDAEFVNNFVFNSIAYGDGPSSTARWIAAGYKVSDGNTVAAMAYSDNAINWTEIALDLNFSVIEKIIFANNLWMIVGNQGGIATSANGDTWASKTSKLDYSINTTSSKILSATTNETKISISRIEVGTPVVFTKKNHGLKENDKVMLDSSGTPPAGLDKVTEYFVNVRSKDTFALKKTVNGQPENSSSAGSGGQSYRKLASTFKVSRHGLLDNDPIRIIPSGAPPSGLAADTIYYVKNIDRDRINLSMFEAGVATTRTSTTTNTIGTGSKTFAYSSAKLGWVVGTRLRVANEYEKWVEGAITAVSPTSVTINVDSTLGSGTFSSWGISVAGGDFVRFVSAQSGSSHKVERFVKTKINSVAYGDAKWVVVGDNGCVSFSTNAETWTAINATFDSTNIFDIKYANSTWFAVGASGKARTSTNLTSWSNRNVRIGGNLNTVHYASPAWIVAGADGKASRSTDLSSWKITDVKFGSNTINQVSWQDKWLAIGQKLKVSTSTDGITWINNSKENVGELKFTTLIPHEFTPFDQVILTSTGNFPSSSASTTLTSISVGSPAVFTLTNHGLLDNDEIGLTTSDTLPEPLEVVDNDENIVIYYVKKINNNTFNVSASKNGTLIDTTSGGSGTQGFFRPSLKTNKTYYVTPKNITKNSFTLADSRENSRLGRTVAGTASEQGIHKISLYTTPDTLPVSNISLNAENQVLVEVAEADILKLQVGDRVFFGVKSADVFVDKQISGGIVRYAPYYVHSIDNNKFLFSENLSGDPYVGKENDVTLENFFVILNLTEEIVKNTITTPSFAKLQPGNLIEIESGEGELSSPTRVATTRSANSIKKTISSISIAKPAIISCTNHNLFSLDIITFSTTGTLPFGIDANTPYLVQKIDNNQFTLLNDKFLPIETKSGAIPDLEQKRITITLSTDEDNPGTIFKTGIDSDGDINTPLILTEHGFTTNQTIVLLTNGTLPTGLNTATTYYVKVIDKTTFNLTETSDGSKIEVASAGSGEHSIKLAYRKQEKVHSFAKNINDKNKIILTKAVNKEIKQYKVSQQDVLVDIQDGETRKVDVYEDISYKNSISVVEELEIIKSGKAGFSDKNNTLARSASRNGIIKNFLTKSSFSETDINKFLSTQAGTIQSSAFIFDGPSFEFEAPKTVSISIANPAIFTTQENHNLDNNNKIKLTTSGALPTGLKANTIYYVNKISNTTFSISTAIGSTPLATTGSQSGIQRFVLIEKTPIDFLSYIYKPLNNKFSHFGTRMRIIGRIGQEESQQTIYNSLNYFLNPESSLDEQFSVYGGSAGLGVMVNPETNIGYYFEIMALSQSNLAEYSEDVGLFNVVFYKVVRKVSLEGEPATGDGSKAIPIKLFQGITNVIADDGTMVGQFRMANEENPSVYDIAIEYEDIDENTRKFYLLINNKIIAVVDDKDPLPVHNNMALFVRGGTRAMFENVYALANNYSQNTVFELDPPVNSVFGTNKIDVSQSFRKYALSGSIQASYLSGIASGDVPQYNIYFEEFGTIMRECAYFNIKYDKAYPALYAKISETFNKMKGYTVSGFVPSAYGAEFLVFNNTDTALNLDETSGNYLRIQGVTFTQSTQKELTVDDYFDRVSNFSDPEFSEDGAIVSPVKAKQDFLDIKNSRITYGKKEFNISSAYIQSQDEANNLMSWIISKIMKPRKSIGLQVFGMPILQLGDIVTIDYTSNDSIEQISLRDSRFVVYNIEYSRSLDGPSMSVFLSEVI